MSALRRVWHWINGPLPQPKMPERDVEETDEAYGRRCMEFLAESKAYQNQNMRIAERNIRVVLVLLFISIVISIVVPIARAVR